MAVFLTGIEGVNMPNNPNQVPGDELRLNMDTPVTHTNPNDVNRLGALAKELDGFPNGRRLGDDVVDIALQAVDGATCAFGTRSARQAHWQPRSATASRKTPTRPS